MKRLLTAALVALAFVSCSPDRLAGQYQVQNVYGDMEIEPTEYHRIVYTVMEQCTGIKGDFSQVRWFIAKAITVIHTESGTGYMANGLYRHPDYTEDGRPHIYTDYEHAFEGETISHEILHDLYKGDAPLDVAQRCMLTWRRLRVIR